MADRGSLLVSPQGPAGTPGPEGREGKKGAKVSASTWKQLPAGPGPAEEVALEGWPVPAGGACSCQGISSPAGLQPTSVLGLRPTTVAATGPP